MNMQRELKAVILIGGPHVGKCVPALVKHPLTVSTVRV